MFSKSPKVAIGATRGAAGNGSIEEMGVWVERSSDRFTNCLETILASKKRDYVTKWHGATLKSVLQKIHTLEDALLDTLNLSKGLSEVEETIDDKIVAKIRKSDNQAAAAVRMGSERIVGIAAGWSHTLLLTDGGKMMSFGSGAHGCLGTGERQDEASPVYMKAASAIRVMQISAGCSFSLLLTDGGVVYGVGNNGNGQLGVGDRRSRTILSESSVRGHGIAQISAGAHFSLLVTDDGQVMSCGDGASGQLGHGSRENMLVPAVVRLFNEKKMQAHSISAGADHSVCLSKDGSLFSWGRGCFGRLGLGHEKDALEPTPIPDMENVTPLAISSGGAHTLILCRTESTGSLANHVFSFGLATDGQLGHPRVDDTGQIKEPLGELRNILRPKIIVALSEFQPVDIAAGSNHSLVQTEQGLFSFGGGAFGRLGLGTYDSTNIPSQVGSIETLEFNKSRERTEEKSLELEPLDGVISEHREDSPRSQSRPNTSEGIKSSIPKVPQPGPDIFDGLISIAAGKDHSVAVTAAGDVYLWGRNSKGQIGCGEDSAPKQSTPIMLPNLKPHRLPQVDDSERATTYQEGEAHRIALSTKLDAARTREVNYKTEISLLEAHLTKSEEESAAKSEKITSLCKQLSDIRAEKVAVEETLHNTIDSKNAQHRDFEYRLQVSERTAFSQEELSTQLEPLIFDGMKKRQFERKLRYRRLDLQTIVMNTEKIWDEREAVRKKLVRELEESHTRETQLQDALVQLNDRLEKISKREKCLSNDRLHVKSVDVEELQKQLVDLRQRHSQFTKYKTQEGERLGREVQQLQAENEKLVDILNDEIQAKMTVCTKCIKDSKDALQNFSDESVISTNCQRRTVKNDEVLLTLEQIKVKQNSYSKVTKGKQSLNELKDLHALRNSLVQLETTELFAMNSASLNV